VIGDKLRQHSNLHLNEQLRDNSVPTVQFVRFDNWTFIYSSFADYRNGNMDTNMTRTLVISRNLPEFVCKFNNDISPGKAYELAENHAMPNRVYIINCKMPIDIIKKDTLQFSLCDANTKQQCQQLTTINNLSEDFISTTLKYNHTICAPLWYGNRYSAKYFVEFMELHRILGTEHVVIYIDKTSLTDDRLKVVQYYEAEGLDVLHINALMLF
jgi:hypothetical protein